MAPQTAQFLKGVMRARLLLPPGKMNRAIIAVCWKYAQRGMLRAWITLCCFGWQTQAPGMPIVCSIPGGHACPHSERRNRGFFCGRGQVESRRGQRFQSDLRNRTGGKASFQDCLWDNKRQFQYKRLYRLFQRGLHQRAHCPDQLRDNQRQYNRYCRGDQGSHKDHVRLLCDSRRFIQQLQGRRLAGDRCLSLPDKPGFRLFSFHMIKIGGESNGCYSQHFL